MVQDGCEFTKFIVADFDCDRLGGGTEILERNPQFRESNLSFNGYMYVGTGADPGFNASTAHQQNPNYRPFWSNTCEADEVSPEVEAGVVVGLQCLQP
jgi:hypothetical protein